VTARVAFRIGIDPHQHELRYLEAGFLEHLAPASCLHPLTDFYEAAWKGVASGKRIVLAADEKCMPFRFEDHAVCH
jgi:hypothetical protein